MRDVGIGLLGFGTIGAGVVRGLRDNGRLLAARLGARPVLRAVADLDLETDRGVEVDRALLTTDAFAAVRHEAVEVVVELIGGTTVARSLVLEALRLGKPVVTANKALLAEHGAEIFAAAAASGADLFFGASVGGGIPIIRALREGLVANRVDSIHGILNGTCNYILTRMERDRLPFAAALAEAQARGYAEADPSLDIEGYDTAHKAVILASLAHGGAIPMSAVHVEGIQDLSETDIRYARDLGYRIKLLAVIKRVGSAVELRVHPALVPLDHVLASVSGVFNAVMVAGDLVGQTLYYGRGAGQNPTASTVLGDVADAVRNIVHAAAGRVPALALDDRPPALLPLADARTRCYLRLSLLDRPGVLARIAAALGDHGISIASALQKEGGEGGYVPVVLLTHTAAERQLDAALREIDALEIVGDRTIRLRIEG